MTCDEFNEQMAEVEDGTASEATRAHLEGCGACQGAWKERQAFGRAMRVSFEREMEGMTLSEGARRRIVEAGRTRREGLGTAAFWRWVLVPVAAVLAICLIARQGEKAGGEAGFVIDVPFQTEMRIQRLDKNGVVDAVVKQTETAEANFSP